MKRKEFFGKIALGVAAALLPLCMVGCGHKGYTSDVYMDTAEPAYVNGLQGSDKSYSSGLSVDDYYDYESDYAEPMYESEAAPAESGVGGSGLSESEIASATETSRKLIRTVNMEVETTTFEDTLKGIEEKLASMGGYVENEYTFNGSSYSTYRQNKYATITIRVPDDKLDEFVSSVSGTANVISKSTSTEDVTLKYVDVEGKKAMYEAEEQSLLALLEKAETVEDISYLVSRLSEVRYNIENMGSTLRTYDDLVSYATVQLTVNEVEILTPVEQVEKTPAEQIKEGFDASVKDVLFSLRRTGMNLLINSPYIIRFFVVLGLIVGGIYLAIRILIAIIKKSIKKAKAKKEAKNNTVNKVEVTPENTQTKEVEKEEQVQTKKAEE